MSDSFYIALIITALVIGSMVDGCRISSLDGRLGALEKQATVEAQR